jgi:hypothetical protein
MYHLIKNGHVSVCGTQNRVRVKNVKKIKKTQNKGHKNLIVKWGWVWGKSTIKLKNMRKGDMNLRKRMDHRCCG